LHLPPKTHGQRSNAEQGALATSLRRIADTLGPQGSRPQWLRYVNALRANTSSLKEPVRCPSLLRPANHAKTWAAELDQSGMHYDPERLAGDRYVGLGN